MKWQTMIERARILTMAACILLTVLAGSGCQRSTPQWDTLSPFGATRVPPPPTGGYGQPNNYYQYQGPALPQGTPGFEVGKKPGTSLGMNSAGDESVAADQSAATEFAGTTSTDSGFRSASSPAGPVAAVSHTDAAASAEVRETSAGSRSSVRAGGMAVTDLTRPQEPAAFRPPPDLIEITQLPAAGGGITGRAPQADGERVEFPDHDQPVGTGLGANLKWK